MEINKYLQTDINNKNGIEYLNKELNLYSLELDDSFIPNKIKKSKTNTKFIKLGKK